MIQLAELTDYSTFVEQADGSIVPDLTGQAIKGARVVLEHVVRAWISPRGSLHWAPHRGIDARRLENSSLTKVEIEQWRASLILEAQAVDYVHEVRVRLTLEGRRIVLNAALVLVDGRAYPFSIRLSEAGALFLDLNGA